MFRRLFPPLAVAIFLLVVPVFLATAQTPEDSDKLRAPASLVYTWTAPTTGTPVVYYVIEVKINEETILLPDKVTETTFTLAEIEYLQEYQIRVAGVDAEGHLGPFSRWSESYSPELEAPEF